MKDENKKLNEAIDKLLFLKNKLSTPSNDSEIIAQLISDFEYNPDKTEEILNKYNRRRKN